MLNKLWLIPILPFIGFLLNGLLGKRLGNRLVTAVALLASFGAAVAGTIAVGAVPRRLSHRRAARRPRLQLDFLRLHRRRPRLPTRSSQRRHADGRHLGRLPHPSLLRRLHGPRARVLALLRLPEPLPLRDAGADPGQQLPPDVRRMGRRGALLLPPHRLLLRDRLRAGRRQEGVRRQPHRRLRLPHRHVPDVRAISAASTSPGSRRSPRRAGSNRGC